VLRTLDFGTFRPADDTHLLPVREMEATEQMLQAKNAGDKAKLDAALTNLERVRAERVEAEARMGVVPTAPVTLAPPASTPQ
jgi:phosphonate transport system substrate-binding protein